MARLTRAETQERTRRAVLTAARDEFVECGFSDAKIDAIAARAELTRGAVYSNFPGKRALYFAVLAADAEQIIAPPHAETGCTRAGALGALARAWVSRLPQDGPPGLGANLLTEVIADERTRAAFTQLLRLDALLLSLALERLDASDAPAGTPQPRLVRLAELALTTLHGAGQLSAAAPGFTEPFDVISACEQLADLDLNDWWSPPQVAPSVQQPGAVFAPAPATDLVTGKDVRLTDDGVLAVLGLHRLASAAEDVMRSALPSTGVTVVLVTDDPAELAPLARLVIAELCGCLRQAFPREAWPRLQVVLDEQGVLAAAVGVHNVNDSTETVLQIEKGRITNRADGRSSVDAATSRRDSAAAGLR